MQQAQKNFQSLSHTAGTVIRMREDDSSPIERLGALFIHT